jgi:hypothetical protein
LHEQDSLELTAMEWSYTVSWTDDVHRSPFPFEATMPDRRRATDEASSSKLNQVTSNPAHRAHRSHTASIGETRRRHGAFRRQDLRCTGRPGPVDSNVAILPASIEGFVDAY